MEGFIVLHRKILAWEWFNDSNMVHIFLFLLLSANHKDNKWRGINVKRGQLITGRLKIKAKTGISEQSIRTALTNLQNTGEITIKVTNKFSLITIVKYDDYQNKVKKQPTKQPTTNQQTNQQLTTNNNDNNFNNENNKTKEILTADKKNISLSNNSIKEKKYHIPSIEDIYIYFKENNCTPDAALNMFNYYAAINWLDKYGNVINYKQKALMWFKEEKNHIKTTEDDPRLKSNGADNPRFVC